MMIIQSTVVFFCHKTCLLGSEGTMCCLHLFSRLVLYFFKQVPFEKQCAKNDSCIAELVVDFNLAYVH